MPAAQENGAGCNACQAEGRPGLGFQDSVILSVFPVVITIVTTAIIAIITVSIVMYSGSRLLRLS